MEIIGVPLQAKKMFSSMKIIDELKTVLEDHDIYVQKECNHITDKTIFYIDRPVTVTQNGEDVVYPEFARINNLDWFMSGEIIVDIICNTLHQLDAPSYNDFINNIEYYNNNDCFFSFTDDVMIRNYKIVLNKFPKNGLKNVVEIIKKIGAQIPLSKLPRASQDVPFTLMKNLSEKEFNELENQLKEYDDILKIEVSVQDINQ